MKNSFHKRTGDIYLPIKKPNKKKQSKNPKCNNCKNRCSDPFGNNGQPLFNGVVCDECNKITMNYRIFEAVIKPSYEKKGFVNVKHQIELEHGVVKSIRVILGKKN